MLIAKGTDDDTSLVESLRNEVKALKRTINDLQKTVKVLQSTSRTHQSLLEALRQHTVNFEWQEGTLDPGYEWEEYEPMEE